MLHLAFRLRWLIVPVLILTGLGGAFLATKQIQPTYAATCRLFVAVSADTSPAETYQASLLAKDRVIAYQELIKGDRVAWAVIQRLGLNISMPELEARVQTKSELNSVVIDVSVTDSDQQLAADIANAVCIEFQIFVVEVEAPNSQINVKLVQSASRPLSASGPNLSRNLMAGAFIGLLVGAGVTILLQRSRPQKYPANGTGAPIATEVADRSEGKTDVESADSDEAYPGHRRRDPET